jgi:GTP cyclohydrolase I
MMAQGDVSHKEQLLHDFLAEIGEDPEREGLKKTPARVAEMYEFLTRGYRQDIAEVMAGSVFEEKYSEMVIVKDIDFFSLCEHHLVPFYGKCHIAYIPDGKIIGLSKLPRIVETFSRRLQVQERMTQQIADTLDQYLHPQGVAVVIEAKHLCMMMRGVERINSAATTSAMLGAFRKDEKTRGEFLTLINRTL